MFAALDIAKMMADFAGWVWGVPLIVLLFGTHLFLTVRLGFIQRFIPRAIRLSFSREKEGEGDVSQFGALMTALAATIGTGNIIGVAGAIAAGGPGAVLWMWLTGVFGIATKYGEAVLAVKYRVKQAGWHDGRRADVCLGARARQKWLGVVFAILTCVAAFGIGCMTQANSVVEPGAGCVRAGARRRCGAGCWASSWRRSPPLVILGGVKSIARRCARCSCRSWRSSTCSVAALILIKNYAVLGDTISLIFTSAFTGQAAIGGFIGAGMKEAMRFGIARGLFSNESGLGSAPIVAAAAQTRNPVRQALVSSTGTFWDTVVVCAMTGPRAS